MFNTSKQILGQTLEHRIRVHERKKIKDSITANINIWCSGDCCSVCTVLDL